MAFRKNKKRIDPRYFLHETTHRNLDEELGQMGRLAYKLGGEAASNIGAKLGIGQDSDDIQKVMMVAEAIKDLYEGIQNGQWQEADPSTREGTLEAIKKGMDDVYLMHDRSQADRADHGGILLQAIGQLIQLYEDANLAPPGDKINVQYMKAGIEELSTTLSRATKR